MTVHPSSDSVVARRRSGEPPRAFRWALVGTVAWGVLAFGAVYPWAYGPLAAGAGALGLWGIARTGAWRDPRARRLAVGLGVLNAAIAVQLIAFPYELVAWISPGLDAFLHAYRLGFQPPARQTLSLDPSYTAVALALCLAFSLLLLGLLRTIRQVPLEWLVSQLMGLAVALGVLGIIQKSFIDEAHPLVYGFWQPEQLGSPFGPFVNRNHFAGWMVMVLPIVAMYAVGLFRQATRPAGGAAAWLRWLSTVDGNRVLLVAVMAAVMGASLASTGSRSGMISLIAAGLVMTAFVVPGIRGRRQRLATVAYLGAIVVGAVVWAGSDMVAARFAAGPDTLGGRLSAWRDTTAIIRDFPVFGVGLGAYAQAMLLYQTEGRELMFAQAHNDYVQLAAEGGLLVGIPAFIVLCQVAGAIRRRLSAGEDDAITFWIRRGAVAGLAAIAVQSTVDFSLQMPGNTVLFVLVLAIALHRPAASHARRV